MSISQDLLGYLSCWSSLGVVPIKMSCSERKLQALGANLGFFFSLSLNINEIFCAVSAISVSEEMQAYCNTYMYMHGLYRILLDKIVDFPLHTAIKKNSNVKCRSDRNT